MKYMGSKNRIAKHILPIILKDYEGEDYLEPFAGGMNMIDKVEVTGEKFANDVNKYVIEMFKMLIKGWRPKKYYTREEYSSFRGLQGSDHEIGYVGINCSYCGTWFGSFSGITKTKTGERNYQDEAYRNVMKQIEKLRGVNFSSVDYKEIRLKKRTIIYCDPPYKGTSGYGFSFDHDEFWEWCQEKANEGHVVFVSEYTAPCFAKEVWRKELSSSLSANGKTGKNKLSVERLFVVEPSG